MTLRIDTTREGPRVAIHLAGRIRGENLDELRRQISAEDPSVVVLDLEEVTLVDLEVVRFLKDADEAGVELRHCPPFIRAWMDGERDAGA
jgi:anti-anti-sigma regulatory factor